MNSIIDIFNYLNNFWNLKVKKNHQEPFLDFLFQFQYFVFLRIYLRLSNSIYKDKEIVYNV